MTATRAMGWRPWAVLLTAAVVLYAGLSWRNRDVNRIRRRLERLRVSFNKAPDESALASLRRAQEIAGAFTENPSVRLGPYLPDLFNRQDLAVAIHHARTTLDEIHTSIRDKTIVVAADRQSATTDLAVEGTYVYRDDWDRQVTEFRLEWARQNGEWMIQGVEPLEVIKPPRRVREGQ
ncbi:MAG: hypothetical protein KKC51_02370 [Verrucomicrobia bacterium]|nr:hypothetical protein [Verrucomicrobiota bacterium]